MSRTPQTSPVSLVSPYLELEFARERGGRTAGGRRSRERTGPESERLLSFEGGEWLLLLVCSLATHPAAWLVRLQSAWLGCRGRAPGQLLVRR